MEYYDYKIILAKNAMNACQREQLVGVLSESQAYARLTPALHFCNTYKFTQISTLPVSI